jgi:integrase
LAIFLKDPDACTKLPKLAIVITVLLTTAARRQELVLARWSDVDLRAGTWLVPASNSKTGRAFTIPLSSMAVEAFERLKKRADGSVWVLPGEDPKEHIDAKLLTRGLARNLERMEKLGIKAFTLHDLRRTARTGLGNLGIAPHIGERCLNHSVGGMQDVYDKADYLTERRAALEKWAAHLESLRAT